MDHAIAKEVKTMSSCQLRMKCGLQRAQTEKRFSWHDMERWQLLQQAQERRARQEGHQGGEQNQGQSEDRGKKRAR